MQIKSRKTYDTLELIENKHFFFFNARGCSYEHNIIQRNIHQIGMFCKNTISPQNIKKIGSYYLIVFQNMTLKPYFLFIIIPYDWEWLNWDINYVALLRLYKTSMRDFLNRCKIYINKYIHIYIYRYLYLYICHAILKRGHGSPHLLDI